MRIFCCTHLDDFRWEKWPVEALQEVRIGDKVESESGKLLYVISITHTTYKDATEDESMIRKPALRLELHKYESVNWGRR
jgi:hypothetical protein